MVKLAVGWCLLLAVIVEKTHGDEVCYTSDLRAMKVRVRQFTTEIHATVTEIKRDMDTLRHQNKEQENTLTMYAEEIRDLRNGHSNLENEIAALKSKALLIEDQLRDIMNDTCTCPDTWVYFQGSCYLFNDNLMINWNDAADHCQSNNSHLVVIDNQYEDDFLRTYANGQFKNESHPSFWTDATDRTIEGKWAWYIYNVSLAYENWWPGQPNSRAGDEDCMVLLSKSFEWHDYSCGSLFHPLCESRIYIKMEKIHNLQITIYSINTPFYAFANRVEPDRTAPIGTVRSGSVLFAYGMIYLGFYSFYYGQIFLWHCTK